jgi:Tol biopolymer transport system component
MAVINQSGTTNLALINLNSILEQTSSSFAVPPITKENITYLTDFQDGTQLSQPSWSPDGKMIALSAWHQGYQDIYILNLDPDNLNLDNNIGNSTLHPIFRDKSIDLSLPMAPS